MGTFKETIRCTNKELPNAPLILCDWNTGKTSPLKGSGIYSPPPHTMMINQTSKEKVQLTSELPPFRDIMQR